MKTDKKVRVAVYMRKSSVDERPGENRSFARQMADIEQIISEGEIVKKFTEKIGTSASHMRGHERPEWDKALDGLGYDYDVLVGSQVDRLDRQGIGGLVKILEACEQGTGGRVITSEWDSASSEARIIGPILFELARAESVKIQARSKAGKQVQRDRHDFLGHRPAYCWDVKRDDQGRPNFVVIPERKQHVLDAAAMFLTGMSSSAISKEFNTRGIRNKLGNKFQPNAWTIIFSDPSMSGHRHYGGEIITDDNGVPIKFAEPILGPGTLTKVRAEIERRKKPRHKSSHSHSRKALLVPLIRCADCGSKLYRDTYRWKGTSIPRYSCTKKNNSTCKDSWRIDMESVDKLVSIQVMELISNLEPGSKLAMEVMDQIQDHFAPSDKSRRSEVEAELELINAKLNKFRKDSLTGKIEDEEFEELEAVAEQAKKELLEELELLPAPPSSLNDIRDWGPGGPIGEGSTWASLNQRQRHDLVAMLIGRIDVEPRFMTVGDGNKGSTTHLDIEERVHIHWLHESNVAELKPRKAAAKKSKAVKAS